jgi:hypothetical protein
MVEPVFWDFQLQVHQFIFRRSDMGLLTKYGTSPLSSFSDAPEAIYGTGSDGSVTFDGSSTVLSLTPSSSVYTLTRDIFCYNMTVSDSVRINPNGYRIFVENLLTLGNSSIIGFIAGSTATGSISGGGTGSVSNSLGGNSNSEPATGPGAVYGGADYYKQAMNAVRGFAITASGGPVFLRGGAGGGVATPGGGIVICAARYIASTATTTNAQFSAPGSSSGGGGGVILIASSAPALPSNISTNVAGGAGASAGNYFYIQAM